MIVKQRLLERLTAIGQSLSARKNALALIAVGSVGIEQDRIDAYSDLDFFVIVEAGSEQTFRNDLVWLTSVSPISYAFANTLHGSKVLFTDGIFCEMAVFTLSELQEAHFSKGRVVWQRDSLQGNLALPAKQTGHETQVDHQLGEALTNLYVGLGRFRRGEKLSAQRLIQHYAVDRVLELARTVEPVQPGPKDSFAQERRFEQRFPTTSDFLSHFVQGYDKSPESATAILDWLERHFELNQAMVAEIHKLIQQATRSP